MNTDLRMEAAAVVRDVRNCVYGFRALLAPE